MSNTPSILLEEVAPERLGSVTGGGIGTQIGSMFGAKGAKWGGLADNIIGMFKGGGGSSGGSGGGGGFNLGSLFGGGAKKTSSGGDTGGGDTGGGDTGGGGDAG